MFCQSIQLYIPQDVGDHQQCPDISEPLTPLYDFRLFFSPAEYCKIRYYRGERGGVVVKALRYKPVDRGFDSRWSHWNFSVT